MLNAIRATKLPPNMEYTSFEIFGSMALHIWKSLLSDIRSCHTVHAFKKISKHTCSDSLNLKATSASMSYIGRQGAYCIIVIIIIIIMIIILFDL